MLVPDLGETKQRLLLYGISFTYHAVVVAG